MSLSTIKRKMRLQQSDASRQTTGQLAQSRRNDRQKFYIWKNFSKKVFTMKTFVQEMFISYFESIILVAFELMHFFEAVTWIELN